MAIKESPSHLSPGDLDELFNWLLNNTETIERLTKLKQQALDNPAKRRYSHYRVRNPDGSVCDTPRLNKRLGKRPPDPKRNKCYNS